MMFIKGQPRNVSIWLRNTEIEQVQEFATWEAYLHKMLVVTKRSRKELRWQRQCS